MGIHENDPGRKRGEGSILNQELAWKLQKVAADIPSDARLDILVEFHPEEKVLPQIRNWFQALSILDFSERGQVIRTLSAFKRSGIDSIGQMRELPRMHPRYIKGLHDIDLVRYNFAKQLFPVPPAK